MRHRDDRTGPDRSSAALLVLWTLLLGIAYLPGCALPERETCTHARGECRDIPPGANMRRVRIISSPTPASIYVNGAYVGRTPLKHWLWFLGTTRTVTVVAEPLYPGQGRQELRLRVPPLPKSLSFHMNNPPKPVDEDPKGPPRGRSSP